MQEQQQSIVLKLCSRSADRVNKIKNEYRVISTKL
jgi:hypothetical protein